MKKIALIFMMILPLLANAEKVDTAAQGWQWYTEPKEDVSKPTRKKADPVDIEKQLATLQMETKKALHTAILYPSVENFVQYFKMQNYWTTQAGLFERSAKKAMLLHPELDYNLQHSHYNSTVKTQLAADQEKEKQAISSLAGQYGVMFFYRGNEPLDNQFASVVAGFRQVNGISVIPVSVDGVASPDFPDSRKDSGQATRLGVKYFPALILVEPKSGHVRPLGYGFMTQDDLSKQFFNVATDFKPNY